MRRSSGSRSCTRPRAVRQPRRRAEHVSRTRGAQRVAGTQGAGDGAAHGRDAEVARRDDDPLDPAAGRDALRRSGPVGRSRPRRDVELAARHPRRADRRARRGADRAGALARQAARRAGSCGDPDLAQPARHFRSGRSHHGAAPRSQRRPLRSQGHDTAGGRASDHRRRSDESLRYSARGAVVSAPAKAVQEFDVAHPEESLLTSLWENFKGGTLGRASVIFGLTVIVIVLGSRAQNFFTAVNFNNIITQMAGTTMLAFGVVFVLLLGEIDLSIAYLSGVVGVAAAELQAPDSGHHFTGIWPIILALLIALA